MPLCQAALLYLIEILHQTTTRHRTISHSAMLYLIEILHQTTTSAPSLTILTLLYLIEILHQTTTRTVASPPRTRCILSKFYIKPQLYGYSIADIRSCILSKFYIKPQLQAELPEGWARCILSKFYIKPQLLIAQSSLPNVVSYRNSTSNHNVGFFLFDDFWLYLIEILHQTTTAHPGFTSKVCCILSKFYIKPQPSGLILIDKVLLTGCLPL